MQAKLRCVVCVNVLCVCVHVCVHACVYIHTFGYVSVYACMCVKLCQTATMNFIMD